MALNKRSPPPPPNFYRDHYKAWWVAKGYSQVQGVNYEETFTPIIRLKNLHYLLTYTNTLNLPPCKPQRRSLLHSA
jgi:hypothetical protein